MDDPITSLHYVEPRNHAKNNKNLGKKTYDRATVIKNRKLQSKTKGRNQDPSCYLLTDFFQFWYALKCNYFPNEILNRSLWIVHHPETEGRSTHQGKRSCRYLKIKKKLLTKSLPNPICLSTEKSFVCSTWQYFPMAIAACCLLAN